MSSRFLSSLSADEDLKLRKNLHQIQNGKCFICQDEIDIDIQPTNIDHITPLAVRGKDSEDNFALTHESCNKSKQDSNLYIARVLHRLKKIQDNIQNDESRSASLKDILAYHGGGKHEFSYKVDDSRIKYSFDKCGDSTLQYNNVFTDLFSKEQTCFIEVPIEYIHHDSLINPRGINSSISLLVKEFQKGNPQLHLTLARINNGKIMVFDGQHKAVAQILLGNKRLLLRLFLEPNVDRLTETNTNAGSTLRQIAFDKSIMRQLNNTLYYERIRKYQIDHNLSEDNFDFSEEQLVDYFKGEANIKKYIIDSLKHTITYAKENILKDFVDFEGKAKELPISYSAFEKTFLSLFIDTKLILRTNFGYKSDEGLNPRELEITQLVKLLNIFADEVYCGKFKPEVGVYRIEQKIIDRKDTDITDDHLVAYRISKEEIIYSWLLYLRKVIENYFANTGRLYEQNRMFQEVFPEQLWKNIRNFIKNLKMLPLWRDRSMSSTIFSGKNPYEYWRTVFETGRTPDGVQVLIKPLNYVEMIKSDDQ
ncbi:HNH endonuclease [Geobacter sp.]|uniref:HNH endonuclease n=1 Tax=Geobacter sp. TaxID=46610 RepID=UPI0027BA313C|nr:HNH endonuclease signature motif containing protein [Geobacter sp.]